MTMLGEQALRMLNFGSVSYNCMLLADGKIDAVVHTDATIFNITAAMPILEAAGCVVSGFTEKYPDLSREKIPFIAASNPVLLAASRSILRRFGEGWTNSLGQSF